MSDEFFPSEDYKIPVTNDYLNKFPQGDTTFRVLSKPIIGYVYFKNDNKPVRSREVFESTPDIKKDSTPRHFWAMTVYNFSAERVQILEITQKSIMTAMKSLIDNKNWGSPLSYDLTVTRKGTTMNDTEYSIVPNPKTELSEVVKEAYAKRPTNLDALYEGLDPFEIK